MRRLVTGLPLALAILVAASPPDAYDAWRPLLARELRSREITRPADLYKFLHQGVMGPAHATLDSAHARGWLDGEWQRGAAADTAGRPPLIVPLRPDGRLVRVDLARLRDLAASSGDTAAVRARGILAGAQARTAGAWPGDLAELAALWRAVEADTALWRGCFAADSLLVFTREVGAAGWPAVHHTNAYDVRWSPHYRVVLADLLPETWRRAGAMP